MLEQSYKCEVFAKPSEKAKWSYKGCMQTPRRCNAVQAPKN